VEPQLHTLYSEAGLTYPSRRLFLRAFKHERILEMWAADDPSDEMTLVESYPFCAASGVLGPKRQQGDRQVPEGVYEIHRYNGWSAYHMSLRVNYPNASDRKRGNRWDLGGGIMVHGDCVSIGCIAIEDRPIERVFLSVLAARRAGGRRVPIHILPVRLDKAGREMLAELTKDDPHGDRATLWSELQPIYDAFERDHRVPEVSIDPKTGAYQLIASPEAST
jgi:murein L,D-transpeptidase YafK